MWLAEQYILEDKLWEQRVLEQRVATAIFDLRRPICFVLDDPRWQNKHVDLVFDYFDPITNEHRTVTADIKCDAKATETKNLFYEVETRQRSSGFCSPGCHEASGVDYSIVFVPSMTLEQMKVAKRDLADVEGMLYFIRLPQWRQLMHDSSWLAKHGINPVFTDRDKHRITTGYPVPLELLDREGLIDKRIDLPPRPSTRELSSKLLQSKATASISTLAECLFVRMLLIADDWGRLWADSTVIKEHAAGLRDDITVENIPRLLDEMGRSNLIVRYQGTATYDDGVVEDVPLLAFPGWPMYQKQRWPKPSICSPPPEDWTPGRKWYR